LRASGCFKILRSERAGLIEARVKLGSVVRRGLLTQSVDTPHFRCVIWSRIIWIPAVLALAAILAHGQSSTAGQQSGPPPQPGQLPETVAAPSFTVADKFSYRVVQSFGARGFVGAAIGGAIGQARNSPREWGQGVVGFADRYGSGFGGNLSRQTFAFVLESAFREDPRYFPSEEKNKKERAVNALKQSVLCKTDDGGTSLAYARMFSAFGAGFLTNVWQPKSTSSVGDGFKRGFISLGADTAYNFMQEFLPFTRPISLRHRH